MVFNNLNTVFINLNTAINNYKINKTTNKDKKTLLKKMYEGLYVGHSKPREGDVETEKLNQKLFNDLTTNAYFSGNLFNFVKKQVSKQQREVKEKIEYIRKKIEDYIKKGLPEYVEKSMIQRRDALPKEYNVLNFNKKNENNENKQIYISNYDDDNIYNKIISKIYTSWWSNKKKFPNNDEIKKIINEENIKNIKTQNNLEKEKIMKILYNEHNFIPESEVNGDVNIEELNKRHVIKIPNHESLAQKFEDFNSINKCYNDYNNTYKVENTDDKTCDKHLGLTQLDEPGVPDESDTPTSSDTRVNNSPDIWDFDIKYNNNNNNKTFFNIYYEKYTFYIEKDRYPNDKFIEAYEKFIKPNNTDENSFKNFNSEFKSSFNKDFLDINNNDIKIDEKNIMEYIRLFHKNIKIPQMHYTESPIALQLLHVFHIYYLSNCKHDLSQLEDLSNKLSKELSGISVIDKLIRKEEEEKKIILNILNELFNNDTVKVFRKQQGGKTKRKNKRKTRGGKTVKKQKSLTGNIIFGSWKDGSSIFKDSKGYYIIQWDSKKEQECKKHLKSWKPKKDDERLVLKSGKWTKQTTKK